MYGNENCSQPKITLKTKQQQQQRRRRRQHGCSLVTFITTDFPMLLETSRCMPQNTEQKEMTKLRVLVMPCKSNEVACHRGHLFVALFIKANHFSKRQFSW